MVKSEGFKEHILKIITIIGFILGVLSILLLIFSESLVLITAIVGLVFSGYAHNKKKTKIGKTGIILNIIGLILGAFLVIISFFVFTVPNSPLYIESDEIDQGVKGEIIKLFAEDASRKMVVYPQSKEISLKQGQSEGGFGFSIRNIGEEEQEFNYNIEHVKNTCNLTATDTEKLLSKEKNGSVVLGPGEKIEDPISVMFDIPESAPQCEIRYETKIKYENETRYTSELVDLRIY